MCADSGPCAGVLAACTGDPDCDAYQACVEGCGLNFSCALKCASDHSQGAQEYNDYNYCLGCEQCQGCITTICL